jgi:hypothetical protein
MKGSPKFFLVVIVMLMVVATGFVIMTSPVTSEKSNSIVSIITGRQDFVFYVIVAVILLAVFVLATKAKGVLPDY